MSKSISASRLAEVTGGELKGDGGIIIDSVASLADAGGTSATFLANVKYRPQIAGSKAGVVFVGKWFDGEPKDGQALIVCGNPSAAFSTAIDIFAPPPVEYAPGIHPAAVVAESASLGDGVHIGANAVVDADVVIGPGSVVGSGSYVGAEVRIGAKTMIYPNVSIRERCVLGNMVIIHSGTVIGSDGFGYVPSETGPLKIPQVGIVQIDDGVEIGANCCVDRARFGRTWLKAGVKIDNLVQVAHNVEVGECSMLIGQSGIAGSAKIGRGVIVAAQAGVNGHITVGDGAKIAGTSGVLRDVPAGAEVAGTPAESGRELMERLMLPRTVRRLKAKIEALEKEIADMKK